MNPKEVAVSDLIIYLFLKGLDAEIVACQNRLKTSVFHSIRACPDTEHAALAAMDMIDVAFARLRGVKLRKAREQ